MTRDIKVQYLVLQSIPLPHFMDEQTNQGRQRWQSAPQCHNKPWMTWLIGITTSCVHCARRGASSMPIAMLKGNTTHTHFSYWYYYKQHRFPLITLTLSAAWWRTALKGQAPCRWRYQCPDRNVGHRRMFRASPYCGMYTKWNKSFWHQFRCFFTHIYSIVHSHGGAEYNGTAYELNKPRIRQLVHRS